MKKQQRQQKAALKFSKERFLKGNNENYLDKIKETDFDITTEQNLMKQHLKIDLMENLKMLVFYIINDLGCRFWESRKINTMARPFLL